MRGGLRLEGGAWRLLHDVKGIPCAHVSSRTRHIHLSKHGVAQAVATRSPPRQWFCTRALEFVNLVGIRKTFSICCEI
jgi:hypothetical protein